MEQKGRGAAQSGAAIYGLGMIGAMIYFISHASTFWIVVLGILKGIIWPVLLVYGLFSHLGM